MTWSAVVSRFRSVGKVKYLFRTRTPSVGSPRTESSCDRNTPLIDEKRGSPTVTADRSDTRPRGGTVTGRLRVVVMAMVFSIGLLGVGAAAAHAQTTPPPCGGKISSSASAGD